MEISWIKKIRSDVSKNLFVTFSLVEIEGTRWRVTYTSVTSILVNLNRLSGSKYFRLNKAQGNPTAVYLWKVELKYNLCKEAIRSKIKTLVKSCLKPFLNPFSLNPFPHIDAFWRLCSRQLFENIVTKEEIAQNKQFLLLTNVFHF